MRQMSFHGWNVGSGRVVKRSRTRRRQRSVVMRDHVAFGLDGELARVRRRGSPLAVAIAEAGRGMDMATRMRFGEVMGCLLERGSVVLRSEMAVRMLGAGLGEPGPWAREPREGVELAERVRIDRGRPGGADERACALIRALRLKYDVPAWMWRGFVPMGGVAGETPWLEQLRRWTIAVGNGEGLRTQSGVPEFVTRAVAHRLATAPGSMGVPGVFRWAQFAAAGVEDVVARRVAAVPWWVFEARHDAYWSAVAGWAAAQGRQLRPEWTMRVIHQLWQIKLRDETGDLARWTPVALVRRYTEWAAVHRVSDHWSPSGIAGKVWKGTVLPRGGFVEIVELLTAEQLREEAFAMKHCVADYVGACAGRKSAVFSVRRRMPGAAVPERLATVEVDLLEKALVQCRAEFNEVADYEVMMEVAEWARSRLLKMNRRVWA